MNTKTRPLRVLIADDHAPSRDDVREALERDERFGACLLDIRMPGSGLAAAWEIAARLPQTKIVMLTVCDDDADLFAALRAGADGYLLKTMSLQQLPDVLDGIFSGGAAMSPALVARVRTWTCAGGRSLPVPAWWWLPRRVPVIWRPGRRVSGLTARATHCPNGTT